MARADLEQSWAITTEHLVAAKALLPEDTSAEAADYVHFLEHNELELALDALIAIGMDRHAPEEFWRRLNMAAENMGLGNHVAKRQHQWRRGET